MAREPSADEIDPPKLSANCAHVVEPLGLGPVLREDALAERIGFDLPEHGAESGPLESEFESADTAEE